VRGYLAVVLASLGATVFFALATAMKHRTARRSPDAQDLGARQVGRFIASTARSPLYLTGLLCDAGGLALQVYALHIGALAVVQPLMITALLTSLVLNHRFAGTRITPSELKWAAVLVISLVGFLFASGAVAAGRAASQLADHGPATVAGILALVAAVTCVALARRLPHGRGAALIGIAVGITYACTAALIKTSTNIAVRGPSALLTSWQPYVLLAAGATGLLLSQLAFQAGPLTASLPAIATVDPLLSVALGVFVYDESLRPGWVAGLGDVLFLAALSAAAIFLSRVKASSEWSESSQSP
jgi:drug/metabolite transporter (DMT)-like permease